MGGRIFLRSLLSIGWAVDAMRLRADDIGKGESSGINDLSTEAINADLFPDVAGFMQKIQNNRNWRKDDALELRALILSSVSRCWQPNPQNRDSYTDPAVLQEMLEALREDITRLHYQLPEKRYKFHPAHTRNEIGAFGPLKGTMPQHHIVSLTQEGGQGHCLYFDYEKTDGPDPVGCRFFQKSFVPIQKLTGCVKSELRNDPYWKMRRIFREKRNATSAEIRDECRAKIPRFSEILEFDEGFVDEEKELWHDCRSGARAKCDYMDDFQRVMEMLKKVEYKDWSGFSALEIYEALKRSITQTRSSPPDGIRSLSDQTVDRIITTCFEFEVPSGSDNAGGYTSTLFYKESLQCLPLIWDAVEVPRAPFQILWFSTGPKELVTDFKGMHPLCGRLALAPLAMEWKEQGTKYAETALQTLGDSFQQRFDATECFKRKHATCRTLAECWKFLMTTHMADLSEHCAPPQAGFFDVTSTVQSEPFKQSGLQCCCKDATSYCEIVQIDNCTDIGFIDYTGVTDGKCETSSFQMEGFNLKVARPDYCRAIPSRGSWFRRSSEKGIPAAALGKLSAAPCPDNSEGTVKCLYHTPDYGRWGTVQCLETRGWCPELISESSSLPVIRRFSNVGDLVPVIRRSSNVGDLVSLDCPEDYRTKPKNAKAICSSMNGYTMLHPTTCVYDPYEPFD